MTLSARSVSKDVVPTVKANWYGGVPPDASETFTTIFVVVLLTSVMVGAVSGMSHTSPSRRRLRRRAVCCCDLHQGSNLPLSSVICDTAVLDGLANLPDLLAERRQPLEP
jgi:hypothetical protein